MPTPSVLQVTKSHYAHFNPSPTDMPFLVSKKSDTLNHCFNKIFIFESKVKEKLP